MNKQIDFIKEELKEEISRRKNLIEERVKAQDWSGALKREAETEALMCAWQIVCNSASFNVQPVSEDLKKFALVESEDFAEREYECDSFDRNALAKGYYHGVFSGANWQKENMMKDSFEVNTETEWDDVIKHLRSKLSGNEKIIIVNNE